MLTVVLLNVGRFEILWVLDVVEDTAEGWEPVRIICKMHLAFCVDDLPRVHLRIGYFMVVPVHVVVVLLKPWSLVSCGLSSSRTLTASDFLLVLVSLELLWMAMAARSVTYLRGC